jgi:hypothetical protein
MLEPGSRLEPHTHRRRRHAELYGFAFTGNSAKADQEMLASVRLVSCLRFLRHELSPSRRLDRLMSIDEQNRPKSADHRTSVAQKPVIDLAARQDSNLRPAA